MLRKNQKWEGELSLNSLTDLSVDVAKELVKWEGYLEHDLTEYEVALILV